MNLVRSCVFDLLPEQFIHATCFHPTKPIVAIGINATVYLRNLFTGNIVGKIITDKNVSSITLSKTKLVIRTGSIFYVYEYSNLELLGKLFLNDEKSIIDVLIDSTDTYLCCNRTASKAIFVHDISKSGFRKLSTRLDCKKPVSGISMHPSEPILTAYSEGTVRVWDLTTGLQITQNDEILKQKEYIQSRGTLKGFITFSGDGGFIVVGNEKNHFYSFEFDDNQVTLQSSNIEYANSNPVIAIKHHPKRYNFWVLRSNGEFITLDTEKCTISPFFETESITELDAVEQIASEPEFIPKKWILAKDIPISMQVHPSQNYLSFCFSRELSKKYFIIYSLYHNDHRFSLFPSPCGIKSKPESYYLKESNTFTEKFYYMSTTGQIMSFDIRTVSSSVTKDLSFMLETTGILPFDIKYVDEKDNFILFFENAHNSGNIAELTYSVFAAKANAPVKLTPGRDILFPNFANNETYISLGGNNGNELTVAGGKIDLESPVKKIFTSPLAEGYAVIFVTKKYIIYSANADTNCRSVKPFNFDNTRKIKLRKWECVNEMIWNCYSSKNPNDYLLGILTSHRVIITDVNLNIIANVEAPSNLQIIYFNSIYWVGSTLFYITESRVKYLTVDNNSYFLCDLDNPESVFVSIWDDRLFTCTWVSDDIKVITNGIGLLEPLLLGELAITGKYGRENRIPNNILQHIISTFDYKRIDKKLIDKLQKDGYYDVALQLSLPLSSISNYSKFNSALNSRKLKTALEILELHYRKEQIIPPLQGKLKEMAINLATISSKYGYYSISFKCYDLLEDYTSLIEYVIIHKDIKGLNFIIQKLQSNTKQSYILNACKNLLNIVKQNQIENNDLIFTNSSTSFDPTPIVVPDMQGNQKLNNSHILPWAFLDTIQKWFPNRLNAQNLGPSYIEPPQDCQNTEFPCLITEIISVYVLRMKGILNIVTSTEKSFSQPPKLLEPPPVKKISLERDYYSFSSSSVLSKNQIKELKDPETSVISMTESYSDDESKSATINDTKSEIPESEEFEDSEENSNNINLSENVNDLNDVDDISNESNNDEIKEEKEKKPVPKLKRSKVSTFPVIPSQTNKEEKENENDEEIEINYPTDIINMGGNDIDKYNCITFVRWGYIGNLKRRELYGSLPNVKVPVHEYFSAFDNLTSALRMLDIGMISSALCYIDKAINLLISGSTSLAYKRKEIKICVYYKLAIRILTTIKFLDHSGDIQEIAYLCRILASIPLRLLHRISFIAMAADKNLIAKNYGVAAKCLRALQKHDVFKGSNINTVLKECETEKFSNSVGYISNDRNYCCYSTFKEIPDNVKFLFCNFCDAVFMLEVKQPQDPCCFCNYGVLEST